MEKPTLDFVDRHGDRFYHDEDQSYYLSAEGAEFKETADLIALRDYLTKVIAYREWQAEEKAKFQPVRFYAAPDTDILHRWHVILYDKDKNDRREDIRLELNEVTPASEEMYDLAQEISKITGGRKVMWTRVLPAQVWGELVFTDSFLEPEKCDVWYEHYSCNKEAGHSGMHFDRCGQIEWCKDEV